MSLHPRVAASMTKAEKRAHVASVRANAAHLRRLGNDFAARLLERGAENFEREHKLTRQRTVLWEK